MPAIGVCDKDLSEHLSSYDFHELFYPVGIQFIENLIAELERFHLSHLG